MPTGATRARQGWKEAVETLWLWWLSLLGWISIQLEASHHNMVLHIYGFGPILNPSERKPFQMDPYTFKSPISASLFCLLGYISNQVFQDLWIFSFPEPPPSCSLGPWNPTPRNLPFPPTSGSNSKTSKKSEPFRNWEKLRNHPGSSRCHFEVPFWVLLVGGWTNPFEKYVSNWIISLGRDENKKIF